MILEPKHVDLNDTLKNYRTILKILNLNCYMSKPRAFNWFQFQVLLNSSLCPFKLYFWLQIGTFQKNYYSLYISDTKKSYYPKFFKTNLRNIFITY